MPPRFLPAADVLAGETADVYFERARRILAAEGMDPVVTMEIFAREEAVLCGAEEALAYLRAILGGDGRHRRRADARMVESLHDGDLIGPKEVVMRITARYSAFGLYETAILGILSQSTGWATAARRVVEAAAPIPVIGFGARHVHPTVADQMDYASVVGGCVGASTPAGARPRRPGADRDHAARPDHHLRRHGPRGARRSTATSTPTCRASCWSTPSRTRRRSRCAWRMPSAIGSGGSGSTRRPSAVG